MRFGEEVVFEGDTMSGVHEVVVKIDATICREGQIVQFLRYESQTSNLERIAYAVKSPSAAISREAVHRKHAP